MKLYGLFYDFDIRVIIQVILRKVFEAKVSLVFCIDSKFLYNCLVKLGNTHKKCLIIDIMSFCQLYKKSKIMEIKWIYAYNNPADSMTKSKLSSTLKMLVNINSIDLDTTECVK